MSAIFISHSSADNALADELRTLLSGAGHRSVFLDFDPAAGIPAGRDWERELYAQLRACQAVVVLCSAASVASAWCFAEITHARALGKAIFPVKLDAAPMWSLLTDLQVTDLTRGREAGWQRLLLGLKAAGLDPASLADWDGSRPPYPGLLAFEKQDAAVYFGREAAIQSGLETLARLRRLGGPRLVLVLGASGSGKSSLVRAGIVPRLERETSWRVAPPFRPLARPLEGMALALAALPGAPDWKVVRPALDAEAGWRSLVNELRSRAGPEASVLLVVDQLEEALEPGGSASAEREAFLRLLCSIAEESDGALFVLATLRSDFLGAFQSHPLLRGLAYEPIHIAQIALAEIGQVIEGPARVAGIELEPGLAQAMVADTATDDALPLLAFTLRELYDRHAGELRQGARLTIDQYRVQLGGLQGALARAAEALCEKSDAAELETLRRALLALVRIDGEGRYVRRPRAWSELPGEAHAPLERFVKARLLSARSAPGGEPGGERVLEVAHEALFRSWSRLAAWLAADREFMLWRERLLAAQATWERNQRDASLVLRGPLLAEAERWRGEREADLGEPARAFVDASIAARDAVQAALVRRRRNLMAALVAVVVVFGALAAAAGWQWRAANQERRMAEARQLNAQGDVAFSRDPVRGLLLTVLSLQSAWTPDAHGALVERLDRLARRQPSRWKPHPGPIRAMALSPDRRWLATAGPGHLQLQSADGPVRDLGSRHDELYLHALAFSPDGAVLAANCEPVLLCVYDVAGAKEPLRLAPARGPIAGVAFGDGGHLLASFSRGVAGVRLFAWPGGAEQAPLETGELFPEGLTFSPDGRRLALSNRAGIEIWDPLGRRRLAQQAGSWKGALAFSSDGKFLVVANGASPVVFELGEGADGQARIAPLTAESGAGGGQPFSVPGFSADARYVASSDSQEGVRITGRLPGPDPSLGPVPAGALVFAAGRRVLAGGLDGMITEWEPDERALRRIAHAGHVHAVALNGDGSRLATASQDELLRLFDTADGKELLSLRLACDPGSLAFSADGRWLAAVQDRNLWLVDAKSGDRRGPFGHEARVTGVRFEAGGARVATSTLWDGDIRYQVRRPTRLRVWDIASGQELGWRFDIEGDRRRTLSINAKASLEAVKTIEGGDAALVQGAAAWPLAYTTDDLNFYPLVIEPPQPWLAAKTTAGTPLVDLVRRRAMRADSVDESEHRHALSADGRLLASAAGHEARLWPLRVEDLIAEACVRLPRNLSCAEWKEAQPDAPYVKACPQQPDPPDLADCQAGTRR